MRIGRLFFLFFVACLAIPAQGRAAQWYIRAGGGVDWSTGADFHDQSGPAGEGAPLFGSGVGSDGRTLGAYGDFGSFPAFEIAAGVQPLTWLRTDLSLTYRMDMDYGGQANFRNVRGEQPVTADGESLTPMVNLFFEPASLAKLDLGIFIPYIGGGIGLSYNHIGPMTYRFPGLTRHKISVVPSGSRVDFAFMLTAGTGIRLSERFILDLSYRYSDLGRIATDSGNMYMDYLPGGVDILGTSAPLRTHGFLLGLRYLL